jgi:primosomal protein N' (replication factor Y)
MPPRQQCLFGQEPAPWDEDDAAERLVASVVFAQGPEAAYDYAVPENLRAAAEPGRRVRVPFGAGNRSKVGYCVRVETRRLLDRHGHHSRLKELAAVIDDAPLLDPAMLRLTQWIADYYLCPWGQVLETVLPAGVRGQAGTRRVVVYCLPEALRKTSGLAELKLSKKQADILSFLASSPQPQPAAAIMAAVGCTEAPIHTLKRKGLLLAEAVRIRTARGEDTLPPRESHLQLNADQQRALDAILVPLNEQRHETILLHGITGSGKTEVYIQAIERVLRFGRQAIVLVPEISLTPQTRQRFCARFGDVAVLHSNLSDVDRYWHWERIARGEVSVVIGARSAVFAPTPHLGLIVMDEEHENTFKQETAPRYHAREVALQRAKSQNVPLVLGSATPSLETWHKAAIGEYRWLSLPRRIFDRPLPRVGTIDLRTQGHDRSARGAISRPLRLAMERALEDGGQVILFLNRRGYSTHIQCPACGAVVKCPSCDMALTHHRHGDAALCHYCNYQTPTPTKCPSCSFTGIRYSGLGTQRLEAEVAARFKDYKALRMDADTMQRPGSHEKALAAFRSGEVRILLGTQMIAKGLDFPGVTLVGVINADTALHLPDFRASERTFQLIVQVAGRTGRGEQGGTVLVQSLSPDHPAIALATSHDYEAFARLELPVRQTLGYPPFAQLIRIVVRGEIESHVRAFAEEIGGKLRAAVGQEAGGSEQEAGGRRQEAGERTSDIEHRTSNVEQYPRLLGPAPCPFPKLRGEFRYQIHVQGPDGGQLRSAMREAMASLKTPENLRWTVDVDPVDMM